MLTLGLILLALPSVVGAAAAEVSGVPLPWLQAPGVHHLSDPVSSKVPMMLLPLVVAAEAVRPKPQESADPTP